ncbi:bifunctional ADP-dependent NAD(P)H-hydrate dehydratase/NAD(P)H-hydrate epimerase [Janibacter alkaliphilus]|uniref:ADP-dependent (S)-NAD(P)H-hydrate dehydratase n=1 Tax=Janibacter alkaliphilus TaxID=1069963 RepID=A0A852WXQ0_9MICO|nr:hydroxyethylthiazole kinase-like uncharacterized protein yjeF [Janibacter alkaliphilus]
MIEAYGTEDVRAAEEATGELLTDGTLMQRAAKGLAAVTRSRMDERGARRVVALVGSGNNGADALWAISRLAKRGYDAAAVCRDPEVQAAQAEAARKARKKGARILTGEDPDALDVIADAEVVLDGLVGLGGRSGLPDLAVSWVAAIPEDAYVIAVDSPSGQPVSGGDLAPGGVFADESVTFAAPKPVHLLPPTEAACGLLTVIDIGLDLSAGEPVAAALDDDDVAALWPVPDAADDKYSRGVLGVLAGGEGYTGAALLSVTAAVCAGAGMVRYVGTPTPEALVRAAVPEAVHGAGRVQAWAIGPGLDVRSRAKGATAQLRQAREALDGDEPVLLDAGGLDLLTAPREAPTLLTPHAGECARMLSRLGDEVTWEQVRADPVAHARALAEASGATVLLKGGTTLVIDPEGGPVHVQSAAPAWLATAGAGDVLAGLAGTLLAAGLPPLLAGALAAHVHGRAAEQANPGGPVRALGVAEQIPRTVARLLAESRG